MDDAAAFRADVEDGRLVKHYTPSEQKTLELEELRAFLVRSFRDSDSVAFDAERRASAGILGKKEIYAYLHRLGLRVVPTGTRVVLTLPRDAEP